MQDRAVMAKWWWSWHIENSPDIEALSLFAEGRNGVCAVLKKVRKEPPAASPRASKRMSKSKFAAVPRVLRKVPKDKPKKMRPCFLHAPKMMPEEMPKYIGVNQVQVSSNNKL
mmetsp:Transcript_7358/g.15103  ORF Transcript_7358/g.15103 Transcript_7358/m.15103 type:complete len:113 (-) Transcript_7358:334-672(-)